MADLRHSIVVNARPEVVHGLVTTATGLAQWWASDVREAEGVVELGFFDRSTVYRLRLARTEPGRAADWTCETGKEWAGTTIGFRLEPSGANTLVQFAHSAWAAETPYFISCNTTWGELMFRLKAAAEGRSPGPLFGASGMAY